jgi:hypothetical protein
MDEVDRVGDKQSRMGGVLQPLCPHAYYPLTLTLSRREREKQCAPFAGRISKATNLVTRAAQVPVVGTVEVRAHRQQSANAVLNHGIEWCAVVEAVIHRM